MTTQTELKADIADDLGTDDYDSDISSQVTKAIRFYQKNRWWWSESREFTFTTEVDKAYYSEDDDADIASIIRLERIFLEKDNDETYELDYIRPRDLEILIDNAASTGEPYEYTYYNRKIGIYRVPDDAYILRMHGHFILSGPTSDGEMGNVWMENAYDLLRAHVVAKIALFKEQDIEMAQAMDPIIKAEVARLDKETQKRIATRMLTPTSW